MKPRRRIALGIGLFAVAIALITGMRHCLRSMKERVAPSRERIAHGCALEVCASPAGQGQGRETDALAA